MSHLWLLLHKYSYISSVEDIKLGTIAIARNKSCNECINHTRLFIDSHDSIIDAVQFVHTLHNDVNRRLNKISLSYSEGRRYVQKHKVVARNYKHIILRALRNDNLHDAIVIFTMLRCVLISQGDDVSNMPILHTMHINNKFELYVIFCCFFNISVDSTYLSSTFTSSCHLSIHEV